MLMTSGTFLEIIYRFLLSNLGIHEKLPESTAHLDYTRLTGPSIRIFNRIIKYMEKHQISSITEFLGESNIEHYEVVSKEKHHKIQVINDQKFRDVLRLVEIIPFGEDLNEEVSDFLAINDDFEDLLMINKLKRSLKDIKNSPFFQYFGTRRKRGWLNNIEKNEEDVGDLKTPKMIRSVTWKKSKVVSKQDSLKSTIEEKNKVFKNEDIGRLDNLLFL